MPQFAVLMGPAAFAQIDSVKGITLLVEILRNVRLEEIIGHSMNPQ